MSKYLNKQILQSIIIRVIVMGLMGLTIKLYSNSLSFEELGSYFLILTYSYLVNSILFVPFDYFFQAEFLPKIKMGQTIKGLSFLFSFLIIYGIVAFVVIAFLYTFKLKFVSEVILVFSLSIPIFLMSTFRNTLNNIGAQKFVNFSFLIESFLKICFLFVLLNGNWFNGENSLITSIILSGLVSSIYLYYKIPKDGKRISIKLSNNKILNAIINFYPLSLSAALLLIQTQGYRFLLSFFGYESLIGSYSTVSNIGSVIIGAIFIIVNQYMHPKIYHTNGEFARELSFKTLYILLAISVGIYFASDILTNLLLSMNFMNISYVMVFGLLVDGLIQINGALTITFSLKNKNSFLLKTYFLCTLIYILTILLLRNHYFNPISIGLLQVLVQLLIFTSLMSYLKKFRNA
jgi:O-antigen/teichoic acid export membrane protein